MRYTKKPGANTARLFSFCLITCLTLSACSVAPTVTERKATVDAVLSGADVSVSKAGDFNLLVARFYGKGEDHKVTVYLEGDGYAWATRNSVSTDPTPIKPVAAMLAAKDTAQNRLYVARPCQYVSTKTCDNKYWSSHRYSPEIIDAIIAAIEKNLPRQTKEIEIVGFSGGGQVALHVAASGKFPVARVITVAANIDNDIWADYHKISKLTGSLNITDIAGKLAHIPQLHLVGEKDEIVPYQVVNESLVKNGLTRIATTRVIANYDHTCCWQTAWPELIR